MAISAAVCQSGSERTVVRMENEKDFEATRDHVRQARMACDAAVLMSRRGDVWQTDLADISATGVRLSCPRGWRGRSGEVWALDMLLGDDVNVHVMAEVVRVDPEHIALAFARIPEDAQHALWTLLGRYADTLEKWRDGGPTRA